MSERNQALAHTTTDTANANANATVATVTKHGVPAAILRKTREAVEFRYLPEYLTSGGPAVATSLPRRSDPITLRGGAVPPFFAGLLPEGRRLSALRRALKTSADDEFGLLLAVGGDVIGDVTITESGDAPRPVPMLNLPADISQLNILELLGDADYDSVSIPGVQDKFSGRMLNLHGAQAGASVIVKLDPPDFPHVVRNEAAFLRVARESGLRVPEWRLATDAMGVDLLIVTRFDREGDTKFAVEDASQVLGIWPADKYHVTAEETSLALIEHCAARAVAAKTLFEQVLFAVITGNGDQHAKNVSMIQRDSEWRISPAYDLPSTAVYGDATTALSISGSKRGLSRRKALRFAERIGLPQRAAERSLDRLLARTASTLRDLTELRLPYSAAQTRDWQRELDYRRRLLDS